MFYSWYNTVDLYNSTPNPIASSPPMSITSPSLPPAWWLLWLITNTINQYIMSSYVVVIRKYNTIVVVAFLKGSLLVCSTLSFYLSFFLSVVVVCSCRLWRERKHNLRSSLWSAILHSDILNLNRSIITRITLQHCPYSHLLVLLIDLIGGATTVQ